MSKLLSTLSSVPRVPRTVSAAAVGRLRAENAKSEGEPRDEAAGEDEDGKDGDAASGKDRAADADANADAGADDDEGGDGKGDEDKGDRDSEGQDGTASAVAAETARCQAIVTSKEGMANPALAHELAFDTSEDRMSAERAIRVLGKAGPAAKSAKGGALGAALAGQGDGLGPDAPAKAGSPRENQLKSVGASLFGKDKAARAAR